ncbi:MAG: glycerol-3-phosphate 1-O-acyltransferase PlsY [Bacteroidales bacterium]|nr:glycerol-3-phosphate 1-O-acyltransferase PlsY [Bacteroidales bacterium]
MELIKLVSGFLLAYLLGSIPTSVWVGKIFYHVDIRNEGSGNAGATNTIRVLGIKAGIPVIIVDVMKGFLAVYFVHFFTPPSWSVSHLIYAQITAGFIAVLGHVYPVFAGFRGGKGVATLLGMGIAVYASVIWVPVVIFLIVLLSTGYVSLGSMLAGISFPVTDILIFHDHHPGKVVLAILAAIFLIFTHRKNIGRLRKGTENRFHFKKKSKIKD